MIKGKVINWSLAGFAYDYSLYPIVNRDNIVTQINIAEDSLENDESFRIIRI